MITDRDREVLTQFSVLLVAFSGGKDSLACYRWALETGKPVRAIMTDTGNEPPDTPDYLNYVRRELGPVEVYQRDGHTFADIVRARGMWPIPGRCLVSSTTKRDDFAWYLRETDTPDDALIILGQRRSESAGRSALSDFSPIIRSGRACYRPILDWSITDVFSFLDVNGLRVHPAYANGRKRVGCVWCVSSSLDDITRDNQLYPARCQELRELRASIGLSSIPGWAHQMTMFESPLCKFSAVHCE